jgi:hypothetical protein
MNKSLIGIVVGIILLVGGIYWLITASTGPGKYDTFAQCVKENGAVFYGAFWCPHCQNQKKMFGNSAQYLPYVECSTPDGNGQLATCTDKNIESYPTWEFSDGTRETGEVSFSKLAEKTSCQLP